MYLIHARTFDRPSSHRHTNTILHFPPSHSRASPNIPYIFAPHPLPPTFSHFSPSSASDFFPFSSLFVSVTFKPSFLTFIDIHYIQHIHFILTSHCNMHISNYKLQSSIQPHSTFFSAHTEFTSFFVPTRFFDHSHFLVHHSSVLGTYFLPYSDNFPPPPFLLLLYICYCFQLATVWPDPYFAFLYFIIRFLLLLVSLLYGFDLFSFFLRSRALLPTFPPIPHPHIAYCIPL